MLERLRDFQLYISLKKYSFCTEEVEFLNFIVSTTEIKIDPCRVKSIYSWSKPTTFREVQIFLDFANFYRRFIHRYSGIVAPLTELLKDSKNSKKSGLLE